MPPNDNEHDYKNCDDPDCTDQACRGYRAGREAGRARGYEDGFMRGAADGFTKGAEDAAGDRQP